MCFVDLICQYRWVRRAANCVLIRVDRLLDMFPVGAVSDILEGWSHTVSGGGVSYASAPYVPDICVM